MELKIIITTKPVWFSILDPVMVLGYTILRFFMAFIYDKDAAASFQKDIQIKYILFHYCLLLTSFQPGKIFKIIIDTQSMFCKSLFLPISYKYVTTSLFVCPSVCNNMWEMCFYRPLFNINCWFYFRWKYPFPKSI